MSAYLTNLKARRLAITTELAALNTGTPAGSLPNSAGEGLNVDHVGYKDGLYRELEKLNALIVKADPDDEEAGYTEAGIVISEEYS